MPKVSVNERSKWNEGATAELEQAGRKRQRRRTRDASNETRERKDTKLAGAKRMGPKAGATTYQGAQQVELGHRPSGYPKRERGAQGDPRGRQATQTVARSTRGTVKSAK